MPNQKSKTVVNKLSNQVAQENQYFSQKFLPLTDAIRAVDYYGQPIGMNFDNKQTL